MESGFFIIFSLIFGAVFGSFITAASYRLPKNESMLTRSHCPKCNQPLKIKSLIPIFSWLFQKGKCLNCQAKISVRYPITELTTSLLFLISYLRFGFNWNTVIFDLIIVVCLIMIISDLETYIIPDLMQISLLILSLVFIYYNNFDILYSVISAIVYFGIIFLSGFIVEKWKKKDAIGGGDIKFITIAGLVLGVSSLPFFFLFSGIFGVIFGLLWKKIKKNEYFPFGPALVVSFLLLLML